MCISPSFIITLCECFHAFWVGLRQENDFCNGRSIQVTFLSTPKIRLWQASGLLENEVGPGVLHSRAQQAWVLQNCQRHKAQLPVISVSENPRFLCCRFCDAIWWKKVAFENFSAVKYGWKNLAFENLKGSHVRNFLAFRKLIWFYPSCLAFLQNACLLSAGLEHFRFNLFRNS